MAGLFCFLNLTGRRNKVRKKLLPYHPNYTVVRNNLLENWITKYLGKEF